MGEEREELIHEVRDRRGRQTGETGVLTGNSGSKLGSRGGAAQDGSWGHWGAVKGRNVGLLRNHTRVNGRHASGSGNTG